MTIKLTLLKSGEEVISDMKEMTVNKDGQDQVVGYYFQFPCRVKLWGNDVDTENATALPLKMRLLPWMPLAKEDSIPVVADWVISIMEPVDKLKEMYQTVLERYENRQSADSGSSEQSEDSDSSGGSSE
tara:strand:- start:139 stop:525 length:387 start_codon:yes stop_codon:yes gene_type:complete